MYDGDEDWGTKRSKVSVAAWVTVFVLVAAIIAGGAVFISRSVRGSESIEVVLPSESLSSVEIYLSGAVDSEGIYTVSQDSSLGDILQRGGGVIEATDPIRVKVRVLHVAEDAFDGGDEDKEAGETKININAASSEELQTLSGIGPVKAQAIIDYRVENGLFRSVDDLINVSGIGPKTLETIRDQITVVD